MDKYTQESLEHNKPDAWDGIKLVKITSNKFLGGLFSRIGHASAKLWVGELAIVALAWVTDLKASNDSILFISTLIIALAWAYISTRD